MDILKYKDYEGTAELDMSRGICRGKILFIDDLVTYESASPANLQKEFEAAVDDYLKTCAALGKKPLRPFRGLFNVRVTPALHQAATLRAIAEGVSLNDVVVRALDGFLNVGADKDNPVPGAMIGVSKVGLVPTTKQGPNTVDASVINPRKKPHRKTAH